MWALCGVPNGVCVFGQAIPFHFVGVVKQGPTLQNRHLVHEPGRENDIFSPREEYCCSSYQPAEKSRRYKTDT